MIHISVETDMVTTHIYIYINSKNGTLMASFLGNVWEHDL